MGFQNLVLTAIMVAMVVCQYGNCKGTGHHHNSHVHTHSPSTKRLHGGGGFVHRNGTRFVLNGKSHYLNGFNAYWLMNVASDPSTRSKVTTTFQEASQHGLNVARTWAFNDGGYEALQISPGSYDEDVFRVHLHLNHYNFLSKIDLCFSCACVHILYLHTP